MNLNHLFYFRTLAETENYTEAARQLMISQPSLSYAIKKLESDLEFPLFEKKGRNVFLTVYGKEMYAATKEALGLLDRTTESIQKQRNEEMSLLTIGLVPTLASGFLPEIIKKGRESGMKMSDFQIFHGFTPDIIKEIEHGTYDIGFCSKQEHPNMTFIPIKKQPFVLLINNELYESPQDLLEKWFNLPLVTYRKNVPIGQSAQKIIEAYTNQPNIIAEFDDETSIGGFVSVNPSIAVVANTSLLKQFNLPIISLKEDKTYHTTYLAYLTKNEHLEKIKTFRKLAKMYSDF